MILQQTKVPGTGDDISIDIHGNTMTYGRHNDSSSYPRMISVENRNYRNGAGLGPISSPASKPIKHVKPQRGSFQQTKWFAQMIQIELIKSLQNCESDDEDDESEIRHPSESSSCGGSENAAPCQPPHAPGCSCDLPENDMTIEQLQHFVVKQMPSRIQRKVPAEAWNQIFGSSAAKKNTFENQVKAMDLALRHSYSYRAFSTSDETKTEESRSPSRQSDVTFGEVGVRYYERSIEYNPATSSGPAIGLGWTYTCEDNVSVNDWETSGNRTRRTRGRPGFLLSRQDRIQLLLDNGYSQDEIAECSRMILKARNERALTARNHVQGIEDAVETASRRVKQLLTFGKKKGLLK